MSFVLNFARLFDNFANIENVSIFVKDYKM